MSRSKSVATTSVQSPPSPPEPPVAEGSEPGSTRTLTATLSSELRIDQEGIDPHDQERASGIGGSDAASIIGVSPFRDRLDVWMEKTHHPKWTPKAETGSMRWGKLQEPLLASEYARLNHVGLAPTPGRIWHPNGIQNANPDGFVLSDEGVVGLWEGKTGSDPSEWDGGVPVFYLPQVQQYMAVTSMPWCDVSVYLGAGDFRTFRVESDTGYQMDLEERVVWFWETYVKTGKLPPEALEMPDIVYPAQHEPESRLTIARGTALDGVIRDLLEVKAKIKALGLDEEALTKRAKMVIAEHGGADGEGWTVHWRQSKPAEQIGWEQISVVLLNYLAAIRRVLPDWETGPAAAYLSPSDYATVVGMYTRYGPRPRPFIARSMVKEAK